MNKPIRKGFTDQPFPLNKTVCLYANRLLYSEQYDDLLVALAGVDWLVDVATYFFVTFIIVLFVDGGGTTKYLFSFQLYSVFLFFYQERLLD